MTNIDVQRLAVDREYWDSVASEQAEFALARDKKVIAWSVGYPHCWSREVIPRPPKKAQEVEWDGEGLPPAGCECEMTHGGMTGYSKVLVIGYYSTTWAAAGRAVAVKCPDLFGAKGDHVSAVNIDETLIFRPIKTKQQRLRDELALCLQNSIEAITGNKFCDEDAELLADNLMLKGWTKEPKP